ncbi:Pkinase-domain-containing protein [Conidiobolus coronatus NRRL 28638]|uniref:non-specific serine/threonine protein kinase n=1 Tax=Conidiobolus coronatus (strain ATCC 28846 / CBS 209.66 / NRRL 28638) TaxID=796925 RepID=A0A137NUB6_CONC2|nr:Pkinase-domain-containing protein [Conidiobolus coronatus NRRL 28638]|eukprot:KXN66405.1 Pkinase-domain-containing protein [Conidiobolus coronatus NRRL 28638]
MNIWAGLLDSKPTTSKSSQSPSSSTTSSTSTLNSKQPASLSQKYGVCERKSIGKGATAVVKVAHKLDREQKEQHFAVKEFRKKRKDETQKEYIKKLTSEFCISSALVHPNVVATIDLIQDEQQNWCQVMEYCPGGDLYNIIKSNHMTEKEINCCFKQLILGLNYLHSMGVAHRDIKPENLIFDDFCRLKITDFGVSDVFKTVWEKTCHRSRGLCGSEPYIAPEMWSDEDYDARLIDVWACGIVYYSMRHRSIPFRMASLDDCNYKTFIEKRRKGTCSQFNQYSEGCKRLMERILEPNPDNRITIAEILEDEWFKSIEVCNEGDYMNSKHKSK